MRDLLRQRFGGIDFRRDIGFRRCRHADQVVALFHADAPDTVCLAAHGADVFFVEADGLAFVRGQEHDLLAVGEIGCDQFVALLDADGVDAVRAHVGEVLELGLFHQAVAGGEENVLARLFEIADGEHGANRLARLQADQVADVLAFAGSADVGNFVHLQPVDASGVGEDQNVGVRGIDEEMLDEILVARLHAGAARAAAALHAVGGDRRALHVAAVADRDGDLLVGDQVFEMDFGGFVFDHRAAFVAVLFLYFFQFFHDHGCAVSSPNPGWIRTRRCARG